MENGNYGKVTQVIGSTLDAHFAEEHLPSIYNALRVEVPKTVLGQTTTETLWCEVAQHLGDNVVRTIAMDVTDGLVRGMPVKDTGNPSMGSFRTNLITWLWFCPSVTDTLLSVLGAAIAEVAIQVTKASSACQPGILSMFGRFAFIAITPEGPAWPWFRSSRLRRPERFP